MYGEAGAVQVDRSVRGNGAAPPKPVERVSDITCETINLLESCLRAADHLIGKTLGPRPSDPVNKLEDIPSLMSDARRLNILAHQLQARFDELHAVIGHDKQ